MKKTTRNHRQGFAADRSGTAAVIFGLAFVPIVFAVGAATDYARYVRLRSALQQATDSATLYVAAKMGDGMTVDEAKIRAQTVLNSNYDMGAARVTGASISEKRQTLCVYSRINLKNAFMQIANLIELKPTVKSCADLSGGVSDDTTYEVALVLDNSGSMRTSSNGQSKISILKSAADSFIETMYSKSRNVKFSVVPFASGVVAVDPNDVSSRNAAWVDTNGSNSQHWNVFGGKAAANAAGFRSRFDIFDKLKARNSKLDWRGCFESPTYPLNVQDTTPTPTDPETLFVPYLSPDEPSTYGANYWNSYMSDNPAGHCSGSVSDDWSKLNRVCKYKDTTSLSGAFEPTGFRGSGSLCPDPGTQMVLRLTPNRSEVENKVEELVANGGTNLHEGFMWGWRTLSPGAPFSGGRPYNAEKNRKIMVFMTDGFNSWNSQVDTVGGSTYEMLGYYSYNGAPNPRLSNGSQQGFATNYQDMLKGAANNGADFKPKSRLALDDLTLQACKNAKEKGIEVFTIGFSIPGDEIDTQGLNLLKACATSEGHYFKAENATQLNSAFASIGRGMGALRLSE